MRSQQFGRLQALWLLFTAVSSVAATLMDSSMCSCSSSSSATIAHISSWLLSSVLKCPDGSIGRLHSTQDASLEPFTPAVYRIDCSPSLSLAFDDDVFSLANRTESTGLQKRQDFICTAPCTKSCYSGSGGPNPDHCDDLAEWMWLRGLSFIQVSVLRSEWLTRVFAIIIAKEYTVRAGEKIVLGSGSCVYTFTNQGSNSVTWCDDEWVRSPFKLCWMRSNKIW